VIEPRSSPKNANDAEIGVRDGVAREVDVPEQDARRAEVGSPEAPAGPWARLRAYFSKNRSRVLRFALLVGLLYAVTDLVSSAPQDATLSLPMDDVRRQARAVAETDEVEITISEIGAREPLTHTRTRVADDVRDLRHAVHLAPGLYTVRLEMRGAEPREGRFEIPADGVVRVRWRSPE
jgi:hypothetical protein